MKPIAYVSVGAFLALLIVSSVAVNDPIQNDIKPDDANQVTNQNGGGWGGANGGYGGGGWGGPGGGYGGGGWGGPGGGGGGWSGPGGGGRWGWGSGRGGGRGGGAGGWGNRCRWGCCSGGGYNYGGGGCRCCYNAQAASAYMQNQAQP